MRQGHNYVRWLGGASDQDIDWDVNGRQECVTPKNILGHEGKAMTARQVDGYFRGISALTLQRQGQAEAVLAAYRESASLYPESGWAWNNLAWLVATREVPIAHD